MRTDQEILAKIQDVCHRDWMGTIRGDLIGCLPFETAKEFLKPETTVEAWVPERRDREAVIARMLDYMPFAWEKANDCRGLSAGRSMDHFTAWIWLIGDDLGNLSDYQFYGKDNLVKICEKYGWNYKQWDDGIRSNTEY